MPMLLGNRRLLILIPPAPKHSSSGATLSHYSHGLMVLSCKILYTYSKNYLISFYFYRNALQRNVTVHFSSPEVGGISPLSINVPLVTLHVGCFKLNFQANTLWPWTNKTKTNYIHLSINSVIA